LVAIGSAFAKDRLHVVAVRIEHEHGIVASVEPLHRQARGFEPTDEQVFPEEWAKFP
jgi:hypothetical protein